MKELSEIIYSYFTGESSFTDVVSTRFFPLIADEDTNYPFAIYQIGDAEPLTKEAQSWPVTISLFFDRKNYTECADFIETVRGLITNKSNWSLIESNIDFAEDDQIIIGTINFEIIY